MKIGKQYYQYLILTIKNMSSNHYLCPDGEYGGYDGHGVYVFYSLFQTQNQTRQY